MKIKIIIYVTILLTTSAVGNNFLCILSPILDIIHTRGDFIGLFSAETTSVWSFEERGSWATHRGDYPGNCSPMVVKNILLKYTKENDIVLDQFLGSGTAAIEALLLNRKIICKHELLL